MIDHFLGGPLVRGYPPRGRPAFAAAYVAVVILGLGAVAGCGSSEEASEPLRDGVYEYELSEEYLLENGISSAQAANESGTHRTTLDAGEFIDRWRTAQGRTGSCRGTYEEDGNRVTFRWTSGCFGDWAMSYSVDGDVVTWSDFEALPPHDGEEEQKVTEVFNGVPWTRVGDAEKGES
jgi:hypothetical protein